MSGMQTTITIEFALPHLTDVVNVDAEDELRSWLRRLKTDPRLPALLLGCEVEEVPSEAETEITVDFGHPPVH